jgi:hypothetical protein
MTAQIRRRSVAEAIIVLDATYLDDGDGGHRPLGYTSPNSAECRVQDFAVQRAHWVYFWSSCPLPCLPACGANRFHPTFTPRGETECFCKVVHTMPLQDGAYVMHGNAL